MDDTTEAAAQVGALLIAKGWTLAIAESCTGGLIGHSITSISGSSAFFMGGIIAYADHIKRDLVGVPGELLVSYGAVSSQVVLAMAQGVRRVLGTDVGLAVTGIAGPTGATPDKPVGTVYVGLSSPIGDEVAHYVWGEDRSGNKRLSAVATLALLEKQMRCS